MEKLCNSLKMRLLLRLSKRDGELNINEQIAAILADPVKHPVFTSNADDAFLNIQEYTLITIRILIHVNWNGGMVPMLQILYQ
jgi:hypothetical protein